MRTLATLLQDFAAGVSLEELNSGQNTDNQLSQSQLDDFKAELATSTQLEGERALLDLIDQARTAIAKTSPSDHSAQVSLQAQLDSLAPELKAMSKALETRHKDWLKLLDKAEKELRARQSKVFDPKAAREARRALLAADAKKDEALTVRDQVLQGLRQAIHFIQQAHWLHSRFPEAVFADVPGLCKSVSREEIAANDYSLTPGRYVGVAPPQEEDEEDFAQRMREIHSELSELNDRAAELAARIAGNMDGVGGMSWQEIQLGDGIHVKHSFAFKGEHFAASGEYMVLTPGNFLEEGGFRVRDGKERFYCADFPEEYLLTKDDLIVAMTEQGEGLLGSAARIPADGKYLHNQRLGLIQLTDSNLLDKRFLYWGFFADSCGNPVKFSNTALRTLNPVCLTALGHGSSGIPVRLAQPHISSFAGKSISYR